MLRLRDESGAKSPDWAGVDWEEWILRKIRSAGALALAAAPLAIGGWATANPSNPQGGTYQTACDGALGDSVVTWSPTNLWPPNHKPRTINITLTDPDGTGLFMH